MTASRTRPSAVLQEAAQAPSPDPRYCFHLAVAYGRLGQLDKARAALQQARAADLDHQLLTKTDRQLLAELEKKLGLELIERAETMNRYGSFSAWRRWWP